MSTGGSWNSRVVELQWRKCADTEWCLLDEIDLTALDRHGVFVVWRPGDAARASVVLYVGSGELRRQIEACRRDPVLAGSPGLRVPWAAVAPADVGGVAAYLYQQLRPQWGEVPQPVPVQPVNLPLSA
jgi:hypothetical protein